MEPGAKQDAAGEMEGSGPGSGQKVYGLTSQSFRIFLIGLGPLQLLRPIAF